MHIARTSYSIAALLLRFAFVCSPKNVFYVFVFPAKNEILFSQHVETRGERAVGGCCFCVSALSCVSQTYIKMPLSTADVHVSFVFFSTHAFRYYSPCFFFRLFSPRSLFSRHFVVFATEKGSTFSLLFCFHLR